MNSAMNVFIYGIFSKEFRRAMKETLLVCKSKWENSISKGFTFQDEILRKHYFKRADLSKMIGHSKELKGIIGDTYFKKDWFFKEEKEL